MGISVTTVIGYLRARVGDGALRFSDIYFAFPAESRALLQEALLAKDAKGYADTKLLQTHGLCREELELFIFLRTRQIFAGDMYEYISDLEIVVHQKVREHLQEKFGSGEAGWWRKGVPQQTRIKCVQRREEDEEPSDDPFVYTNIIDLYNINDKNWNDVFNGLPEFGGDRRALKRSFLRLNGIRNEVMHPVKHRKWSEDEFEFVRDLHEDLLRPLKAGLDE